MRFTDKPVSDKPGVTVPGLVHTYVFLDSQYSSFCPLLYTVQYINLS